MTQPTPTLPAPIRDLLAQARDLYVSGNAEGALPLDQEALRIAEELGDTLGQILGNRYVGLCWYRRGEMANSRKHLEKALDLARRHGPEGLDLRIANHLGNTLRRLGRFQDADRLFRDELKRAVSPRFMAERARLLGSHGALLDELGQRAEADDRYARFEELSVIIGDPHRLANARALAGRAARYRGDMEGALWRAEEERDLGIHLQEPGREAEGWLHLGKALQAQAEALLAEQDPPQAEVTQALDQARSALTNALAISRAVDPPSRRVRILGATASFERVHGRLSHAWAAIQQALEERAVRDPQNRIRLHREAALICQQAGLHGDALWYLEREAHIRCELYDCLSDPRLQRMVSGRRQELVEVLGDLCREAGEVDRSMEEREKVLALVRRIQPERKKTGDEELWQSLVSTRETVPVWKDRIRRDAEMRWKDRLLPGTFERLLPESQTDLIRADLTYQGVVDDLARSVHLLLVVVERELRQRAWMKAIDRIRSERKTRISWPGHDLADLRHISLGQMLVALKEALSPEGSDRRKRMVDLSGCLSGLEGPLGAVLRLADPLFTVSGEKFDLVDTRNAVAHGDERLGHLTRARVDAARRRLVLEVPVILAALVECGPG